MKRITKRTICIVLVLTFGAAQTVFASSGSATYGGATASWSLSSTRAVNKLSYRATAKIRINGKLNAKNKLSGITEYKTIDSKTRTSSSWTLTSTPLATTIFVYGKNNKVSDYINGSCFITYRPQP